jgi:hypothetical protein
MLRRFTSLVVVVLWLSLGSGALGYLHNLQHECDSSSQKHHPLPDDSNCRVHALVHAPSLAPLIDALPEVSEPLVSRLRLTDEQMTSRGYRQLPGCRGPPPA